MFNRNKKAGSKHPENELKMNPNQILTCDSVKQEVINQPETSLNEEILTLVEIGVFAYNTPNKFVPAEDRIIKRTVVKALKERSMPTDVKFYRDIVAGSNIQHTSRHHFNFSLKGLRHLIEILKIKD